VNNAHFLMNFLKNPLSVGAVWPSSAKLCSRMISDIEFQQLDCIVELGPGTGAITQCIAASAKPGAEIISVELDRRMAEALRLRFPRVAVVNASATDLRMILNGRGRTCADAVISALPWTNFPKKLQSDILDAIEDILAPGGYFTTFAYIHGVCLPTAQHFRRTLRRRFHSLEILPVVWRNVPPAIVYRCRKVQ
jgi:phospholipid N-methyltransferase